MTVLEQFSLFQRMAGSIKTDIEEGKTAKALGKLEILEGELGVMRSEYEPKTDESVEVMPPSADFMNPPAAEIIDVPETDVIN